MLGQLLSKKGPNEWQSPGKTPLSTPGGAVWVYTTGDCRIQGFEVGPVPETEMLGHRLGEPRVWTETRVTGVIDCFSLRVH